MLKIYDTFTEDQGNTFFMDFEPVPLQFYASDLATELGFKDTNQLEEALNRSFQVCKTLKIPILDNFKKIYLQKNGEVYPDWKLSNLGRNMLIVNGSPSSVKVAEAQLFSILHQNIHSNGEIS